MDILGNLFYLDQPFKEMNTFKKKLVDVQKRLYTLPVHNLWHKWVLCGPVALHGKVKDN